MKSWMPVDRHTHRIAKAPGGAWGMYCPERGPDALIYARSWRWVIWALDRGTACPHDALFWRDAGPPPVNRPHPTCIDVTGTDQTPRSEWTCGPECPKDA